MAEKPLKVCLVGHGPSLPKMKLGSQIDDHDLVIRFKRLSDLTNYPEIYGSKTDIVCCSMVVAPAVKPHWPKVNKFMVFTDSRTTNEPIDVQQTRVQGAFPQDQVMFDKPLCDFWNAHYREARDASGEPGHNHMSAGLHCLLFVGKYLSPCDVTLYGFDSVATGEWTWSVTRGPDWDKYPDHRFDIENGVLHDLVRAYAMNVHAVLPEEKNVPT